jgi:hypothetical protein
MKADVVIDICSRNQLRLNGKFFDRDTKSSPQISFTSSCTRMNNFIISVNHCNLRNNALTRSPGSKAPTHLIFGYTMTRQFHDGKISLANCFLDLVEADSNWHFALCRRCAVIARDVVRVYWRRHRLLSIRLE